MLQTCDFLVLLLDHNRHLLCLSLKVHKGLLGFLQFERDGRLHRALAFVHLLHFHLIRRLFLLKLILDLLLALLALVDGDFLLELVVLHLLVFEHKRLDLAVELLDDQLVLLLHQLDVVVPFAAAIIWGGRGHHDPRY